MSCLLLVLILLVLLSLGGCTDTPLDPDDPVTLTMWHVYGAQARSPMNTLVDRFNQTVGKEHGVIISVTSISNSWSMHDELLASAREEPGSEELPDLFTCYPKTLAAMGSTRVLDWKTYFSEEELKDYVPAFLEEGMMDGALRAFPLGKSTNLLFVNDTIFESFSKDTGITHEHLATWEGVFQAAARYHVWSGGKAFFLYDDWIQYAMLNAESLGEPFFEEEKIRWSSSALMKIWRPLVRSAANGYVWLKPGYASTAMMMGEAVCGVESSAAILYFRDTVTLNDNSTMPLRLTVLPAPRFSGARRLDIQRGSALCARASTRKKEYAAALFCKWLTSPDIHLPFVIQGGYMPVHKKAFQQLADLEHVDFPDERYHQLYKVLLLLNETSTFVPTPVFGSYGDTEKSFNAALRDILSRYRGTWLNRGGNPDGLAEITLSHMKERVALSAR